MYLNLFMICSGIVLGSLNIEIFEIVLDLLNSLYGILIEYLFFFVKYCLLCS